MPVELILELLFTGNERLNKDKFFLVLSLAMSEIMP